MQPSDSAREEGSADLGPGGSPGDAPTTVEDRIDDSTGPDVIAGDPSEPPTEPEPPQHPGQAVDGSATDDAREDGDTGSDPDPATGDGTGAEDEAATGAEDGTATDDEAGTATDDEAGTATGAGTGSDDQAGPDDEAGAGTGAEDGAEPGRADDDETAIIGAVPAATGTDQATDDEPTAADGEAEAGTPADASGDGPAVAAEAAPPGGETPPPSTGDPAPARTGRRLVLVAAAVVVGLYALLAAAWAVDAATHRDRVMRGVTIDGLDVGGDDRDDLAVAVSTLTDRLADEELEVTVGDETITTDPVTLGAVIDAPAVTDDALAARRGGFLPVRPLTWAAGLFTTDDIPLRYSVDPAVARRGVSDVIHPELEAPVEPELEFDGGELTVSPGSAGVTLDPQLVIDGLPDAIDGAAPHRLDLPEEVAEPEVDEAELTDLAGELNQSTEQPIAIQVLDKRVQVSPSTQRGWIRLEAEGGRLDWSIDEEAALADLQPLFPALGSEDQQARFEVVDGEPIIIPAAETVICCAEGSGAILARTIERPIPAPATTDGDDGDGGAADDDEEPELRVADLEPEITGFDEGVAELESLGIIEEVSSFTTEHACCQNRVTNIHRIADLTQGVIIRPGEEFSLNGFVGRRTRENGFVADGAIAQGNFEQQVGGGISQFATTFFNASFFAGVEFVEYQSHSIYISRYPRGREATISWPKPDLKIRNNTPYGILVWNEYTDTSITVSFYSTRHLEVEALPLLRSSDRQCRIDITPRQITAEDGTVTEDRVRAIYRPGEGLDCNGNSTTPEEAPKPASRPAPEPEPEPDPDPEPAPDPDPPVGDGDGDGDDGGAGGGDDGEVLPPG